MNFQAGGNLPVTHALSLIAFFLVAAAFVHLLVDVIGIFCGTKSVLGPEAKEEAVVKMDPARAALTFLAGWAELRMSEYPQGRK